MKLTAALLEDYAVELVNLAGTMEKRAEIWHSDSRDKFHELKGQANGLRYASEGLVELLTAPEPKPRRLRSAS